MSCPKGFIVVTSLQDGRRAVIRAESVTAVYDCGEEDVDYGVKPEHRCVFHSGCELDVVEGLDEICGMLYNAEL